MTELEKAARMALEALDEIHAGKRHPQLALAVAHNLRKALTQALATTEPGELTRSQKLRNAGYTRRPSWKTFPSDADDVSEVDSGPISCPGEAAKPATTERKGEPVALSRIFDLICNAIDTADTITMEGDYMLDSDDCIAVIRTMQAVLDVCGHTSPQVPEDTARLDWIERQHLEELTMGLAIDCEHDGQYYVCGDSNKTGYGDSLREAIDAARKGDQS